MPDSQDAPDGQAVTVPTTPPGTTPPTPPGKAPTEPLAQARRAAAALRTLAGHLATGDMPLDDLRAIADAAELMEEQARPYARSSRYDGRAGLRIGSADNAVLWERHPIFGLSHPFAPPLVIERRGEAFHGEASLGPAYEGSRNNVHGGYLAALFDVMLGYAAALSGTLIATGTMTIRYRAPVPISTSLRLESEIGEVDGRKIRAVARLLIGDTVHAQADGLFISVGPEWFTSPD
ncbi:PaaI family thioesterase [Frankia sp. Cppng1_Ct_nod]|uniref:PaaI family thioesterase n=1 Tax=Frankia sp. Cppng1_Ct_nod TaxID=2897162 RepID=UPI0010413489|nr:PaaI family thioesterase [Frankia sp. Cppng1_Ct_nod]